jgi:hypothetical protein
VPGKKRVRGIDAAATVQRPSFDPHSFHCVRARCRPPRLAHRGLNLFLRNKDH